MAALPAAPPIASSNPHHEVRTLITRYFFATAAAVAGAAAALFCFLPPGLPLAWRAAVVGGFLLLLALSLAGARVQVDRLRAALLGVIAVTLVMVVFTGVALQWGVNSVAVGFFALLTCIVSAISSRRTGIAVAAICLGALLALAATSQWPLLAGLHLGPDAEEPLALRLALQVMLLAAGLSCGLMVSRVIDTYVHASAEREARFLGLLRVAADAYWEMDRDFNLVSVWERRAGAQGFTPRPRGLGLPPWETRQLLLDDETLDATRADLERHRPFHDLHARWRCRDGNVRDLLVSGEPRFAGKAFTGYWGVVRDITEDMHAHSALAATESRYRELFTRIPTPLVLNRRGLVLEANTAAARLFGHGHPQAMAALDLLQHYEAGEDRERARRRLEELERLPPGQALPVAEFRLRTVDGRRLHVRATSVRVDTGSAGLATLTMFVDDTERRAAEEAVRRSESLLSHLVATSPDVITLTERDSGRFAMVNDTFVAVTGYRREEVIGRTSQELGLWLQPQDRPRVVQALKDHGALKDVSLQFVGKHGRTIQMLVSIAPFEMDGRDYLVVNGRDVTEVERTRMEHEAILQNASIGIAFTRNRRIVQANAHFEQMLGWPRGTLVGQPARVVWASEEEFRSLGSQIGRRLAAGEGVEIERTMSRRDGSQFICRLLAKSVDPQSPGNGTIWIVEDITERRMLDQALAKARDDAEAASRAKSAFLANTSHELRTPLNGLVGLARLARQPDLDEPQRGHYLEQISESAETLSAIINDILDLSKIEAGKLLIENVGFDLHALLQTQERAFGLLAQARGLSLALQLHADVPRHVTGDPVRVRQILGNYLSNALKFTAQGWVRLEARHAGGNRLRFEVRDSGPGIDAATQARLFQPFTQADQSTTRRYGGTGLGLSICQELATLMGGEVGVHSRPGEGSCFWVELPLPVADAQAARSNLAPLDDADPLRGAHVLMVEDNVVNMMIAVALLEQWGVRVAQAGNGSQAIDVVEQAQRDGRPFDAVLMDVQMPEMGGHEATRILRQRYDAHTLPVIALTAAALVSERDEALSAGMNDFLTKPIDAHRLRDTLTRVLQRRQPG